MNRRNGRTGNSVGDAMMAAGIQPVNTNVVARFSDLRPVPKPAPKPEPKPVSLVAKATKTLNAALKTPPTSSTEIIELLNTIFTGLRLVKTEKSRIHLRNGAFRFVNAFKRHMIEGDGCEVLRLLELNFELIKTGEKIFDQNMLSEIRHLLVAHQPKPKQEPKPAPKSISTSKNLFNQVAKIKPGETVEATVKLGGVDRLVERQPMDLPLQLRLRVHQEDKDRSSVFTVLSLNKNRSAKVLTNHWLANQLGALDTVIATCLQAFDSKNREQTVMIPAPVKSHQAKKPMSERVPSTDFEVLYFRSQELPRENDRVYLGRDRCNRDIKVVKRPPFGSRCTRTFQLRVSMGGAGVSINVNDRGQNLPNLHVGWDPNEVGDVLDLEQIFRDAVDLLTPVEAELEEAA